MSSVRRIVNSLRLACCAALLAAAPAWAALVSVNAGDKVTLNYDATAFIPYGAVFLDFSTSGVDIVEGLHVVWYGGLDGTGPNFINLTGDPGGVGVSAPPNAATLPLFDGTFSIVLDNVVGSFDIGVVVTVYTGDIAAVPHEIAPTITSTAVPEPATLALAGAALAGLALRRRPGVGLRRA